MIPKKIHYCWFGGKEMPKEFKKQHRVCEYMYVVPSTEDGLKGNTTKWGASIVKAPQFKYRFVRAATGYTQATKKQMAGQTEE